MALRPTIAQERKRQMRVAVITPPVLKRSLGSFSPWQAMSRRLAVHQHTVSHRHCVLCSRWSLVTAISRPPVDQWKTERRWGTMDTRTHTNSRAHSRCLNRGWGWPSLDKVCLFASVKYVHCRTQSVLGHFRLLSLDHDPKSLNCYNTNLMHVMLPPIQYYITKDKQM